MPDKQQQTKIPSGYDSKDTQDRLDWLNSKINFKYSSNLQNVASKMTLFHMEFHSAYYCNM